MELIDIVIMSLVVGYIFMDMFKAPVNHHDFDPMKQRFGFSWRDFWFSVAVITPAIVLHEFGHKFVAMAYGLQAVFHAAYFWLFLGVLMKFVGFVFFIPAYVSFSASATPLQSAAISFAGPAVNLLLWVGAWMFLKYKGKRLKRTTYAALFLTQRVNMFMFFFNMIPIPPFDGGAVIHGLLTTIM